jgi:hypothetical protein
MLLISPHFGDGPGLGPNLLGTPTKITFSVVVAGHTSKSILASHAYNSRPSIPVGLRLVQPSNPFHIVLECAWAVVNTAFWLFRTFLVFVMPNDQTDHGHGEHCGIRA